MWKATPRAIILVLGGASRAPYIYNSHDTYFDVRVVPNYDPSAIGAEGPALISSTAVYIQQMPGIHVCRFGMDF